MNCNTTHYRANSSSVPGDPTALYGALSSGIIRTRAGRKYPPHQMLALVNKTLYQRPIEGQYIALTFSLYDINTHKLAIANSGLPYPLLIHNGEYRFLQLAGVPLGLFPESEYDEIEVTLESGDILVFFSDGVIEMRNEAGDDFGLKRLADVARSHSHQSAQQIVNAIDKAVEDFAGRAAPSDDRTMIVIKMA